MESRDHETSRLTDSDNHKIVKNIKSIPQ